MKKQTMIKEAFLSDKCTLNEAQAKIFLRKYGIPVVPEAIAQNIEEAGREAAKIGYPVVVKALGAGLTHKTERGLVRLNLKNSKEVHKAALYIKDKAGNELEGFLIQPMLAGKREFLAGLFHDEQFGPVIVFGLGGIFTEALEDVVFRIAPINAEEAAAMIDEVHSQKLLNNFRGEKAPDRQALIKTLVGLSQIGLKEAQVREIDINPLLVAADGTVTAVDALVVLGEKKEKARPRTPIKAEAIGKLFYPKAIAFIGASGKFGKWAHHLLTSVVRGEYQGEIYLVNPKGGKIAGRKVLKSVTEIPGRVDLAIVTVPAAQVISLIPELQKKNIKNMLLISSGFSEVGPAGRALENELVAAARQADIIILGPNTMGICNPHISFYCTGPAVRPQAGGTVLVAQSGNLGSQLLAFAEKEGIGIRAFSGSGNEAMLTIEDYLEGFEVDETSTTVVLYLESVKDGRRFLETVKRVGRRKPVIVLKGGRSEAGAKAAASHTGAMASNSRVFDAACRQAGVVLVDKPMDLLDLSAVFSSLPLPKGNRVGIMTLGGGWGVVATDLCAKNGLEIPKLSTAITAKISAMLPDYWSHANPVDIVGEADPRVTKTIIEELLRWEGCDAVIHMGILGQKVMLKNSLEAAMFADKNYDQQFEDVTLRLLAVTEQQFTENAVKLMEIYEKPVIGVFLLSDETSRTITEVHNSRYKGVSFITPERAVKSLAKMYTYARWLNRSNT